MISNEQRATVRVPATSANLGPGYDCLGIALTLHNTVHLVASGAWQSLPPGARPEMSPRLRIEVSGTDAGKIPCDASNLVYQTATRIFAQAGRWPSNLAIELEGKIPVGSGLGSSSAAVVAGLLGANALTGNVLSRNQLLRMAAAIEGHPDNVAPAILGGLVLGIMTGADAEDSGLTLECLPTPALRVVVALPDVEFPTAEARAVLPQSVSREDAIHNASRMGLLIHSLTTGELSFLQTAMEDRLHQPYRLPLIPGAAEAMSAAYASGANGVALSGAGPSLIAFAVDRHSEIGDAMAAAFATAGLPSRTWVLDVEPNGAHLV